MEFTRVLLKPQVTQNDLYRIGAMNRQWRGTDFTLLKKEKPSTKTWKLKDKQTTIKYIQDSLREVRYYHLIGTNQEQALGYIREKLPTYERAEIDTLMDTAGTPSRRLRQSTMPPCPRRPSAIQRSLTT